jgi:pimeloyl-ACP methyl ester carboxylesterase
MGHSFGGGTVLAAASVDVRFTAVVALDPWLMPLGAQFSTPQAPTLYYEGGGFMKDPEMFGAIQKFYDRSGSDSFFVTLLRARHRNFSDAPWFGSPILNRLMGMVDAPADYPGCMDTINTHVLLYLKHHLSLEDVDMRELLEDPGIVVHSRSG